MEETKFYIEKMRKQHMSKRDFQLYYLSYKKQECEGKLIMTKAEIHLQI